MLRPSGHNEVFVFQAAAVLKKSNPLIELKSDHLVEHNLYVGKAMENGADRRRDIAR
jgi:hypothetical protein